MQKNNKISSVFLYLCVFSGILWLGSYITRLLLTYQLFEPKDFILKQYVNNQNLYGILYTISTSVTITLITFLIFLVTFFLFIILSKISLKENGWLFVITLIIIVTAPFELFLLTIDYKIITKVFYSVFDEKEILGLYIKRLKILSNFSLIEIFSYFIIIFLFLFQPLKMNKKNEAERERV
jgi:hypothetical protein